MMNVSIFWMLRVRNSDSGQFLQATEAAPMTYRFPNRGKIAPAIVSLFIFVMLVAGISHFALPYALKTNYPELSLKLNRNSPAFAIELNNYVSALAQKKSSVSSQVNSASPPAGGIQANSIDQGKTAHAEDFSKMVARSRNILLSDPLNTEYYRLLGQLYKSVDSNDLAYRLMMAASNISPSEIIAHDYIFRSNINNNQLSAALLYGDRLFSIFNEAITYYKSAFNLIIKDNSSRANLAQLLARKPNWRFGFFSQIVPVLANSHSDEISDLYVALNKTSAPPTNDELKYFISSLIAAGKYDLAYRFWISLLTPGDVDKIALVNNGGFDQDPTGLAFDWAIGGGKEVRAQINTGYKTGNRFLNIEFGNGRITFPNISQVIVLKPGNYLIEGKYQGEAIGKRGLFWILTCYRGNKIAESEEIRGKFPDWRGFQFEIKIPEENCAPQVLSLRHGARSPSEQLIRGSISFDDIKITEILK